MVGNGEMIRLRLQLSFVEREMEGYDFLHLDSKREEEGTKGKRIGGKSF